METKASDQKSQLNEVDEARNLPKREGGWITFPFILGSISGMGLAMSGATSNIIVYLIKEYNVKSIDAAQIANIINGCTNLSPVAGAIVADAFFGNYPVVVFSTAVSLLSLVLFALTAAVRALRPPACAFSSSHCEAPSAGQLSVLYTAVALLAVASGGARFNISTMGAYQFDMVADQDIFFNWYFIAMYGSAVAGATAIVYIQDSISWTLGFGVCAVASGISVVALLAGGRYYRKLPAQGSPFTELARVFIAAVRKRKMTILSQEDLNYYYGISEDAKARITAPTKSFSFLNRAAVISNGDTHTNGSLAKPWRLCTVQQVEDFKTILRLLPLWTSSIFLSISIGIQASLTVLQALTMDRSLGSHFTIPAGSMIVSSFAAVIISIFFLDRLLFPHWHKLTGRRTLTPLQRIGLGHVLNAAGMAASALVERRRAGVVRAHHAQGQAEWVVPMTALWLVLPLAITGAGEALHFPGQVALYYKEFPKSLRSTATGVVALIVALGFYLSTAVVDLVRKVTEWLPDNINGSRLENVYWMLTAVVAINFGYFLFFAKLYKYRSAGEEVETITASKLGLGVTDSSGP